MLISDRTKSALYALILLLFYSGIEAQITFSKAYWETNSPGGIDIQPTSDGGYIIGGTDFTQINSNPPGICLVKTDSHGEVVWHKMYNSNQITSFGFHVQQTHDYGYIASGMYTPTGAPPWYMQLVKTDSSGTLQWSKSYNSLTSDEIPVVKQVEKGDGYIIAGNSDDNCQCFMAAHIIRINTDGDVIWTKSFWAEDGSSAIAEDIIQAGDGGFLFTGSIGNEANNNSNVLLVKLDVNGNYEWSKRYGGKEPNRGDIGYHIIQTSVDNGYLISGHSNSFDFGNYDTSLYSGSRQNIYLVKTDANGDTAWTKTYGPFVNSWSEYYPVQEGTDGFYYILKNTSLYSAILPSCAALIKINIDGDTVWSKVYSGGAHYVKPQSMQVCSDGGMIIGNLIDYYKEWGHPQFYAMKTDIDGNTGCHQTYFPFNVNTPPSNIFDQVLQVSSGGTATTINLNTHTVEDSIINCPYDSTILSTVGELQEQERASISIFPNPIIESATIQLNVSENGPFTIELRDVMGRPLRATQTFSKNYLFERGGLVAGVYFIFVYHNDELIDTEKIILE